MSELICCPFCAGKGAVELTGIYAETLSLLRRWPLAELSGAEWARQAGCKATAMNMRLVRLEELGLATSRRYGRQRLFKAVR